MPLREMKPGSLGLMLLGVLQREPNYGYALCKCLRELSAGALSFEDSAIYPLLRDFEREGIVEGYWGERIGGGDARRQGWPRRRYYRLTARGQDELRKKLPADWNEFFEREPSTGPMQRSDAAWRQ